jgi:hypothetical protein
MRSPVHRRWVRWKLRQNGRSSALRLAFAFLQWHKASRLGCSLEALEWDGLELEEVELERLNRWVASGNAWRCSTLDPWSAADVFERVVSGFGPAIPVGPGGAGRWASYPAPLEGAKGGEGVQGEFWPDLGEVR